MEISVGKRDNIISKTDLEGNITYVNDSFVKISEYSQEQLMHQPHNILRHEEMPRAIFELLWARMKNRDQIFAYVINKTANNNFYWVLAHVTPIEDDTNEVIGYQSIRRQANPLAVETIAPLYKQMCELEKDGTMKASMAYLKNFLAENNIEYDKFVSSLQVKRAA